MKISGIILCGGKSSRMGFKNKCFLELEGRKFIEIIIEKLKKFSSEILLVGRDVEPFLKLGERMVTDIHTNPSSLSGIHAGLVYSKTPYNFIVGCDTPLIKKEVIELLLSQIDPCYSIIAPKIGRYFEPLCTIYSKECIPFIEKMLDRECYKISALFSETKIKVVKEELIREVDPNLVSFLNVNTPHDYKKLLKIYLDLI